MDEVTTEQADQKLQKLNSYTAPFPKYEFQIDLMDATSLLKDEVVKLKTNKDMGFYALTYSAKNVTQNH